MPSMMSNMKSISLPRKRMRLGTRSCSECRRRKVRCIYPPESDVCRQCEAHSTPCGKQGADPQRQGVNTGGNSTEILTKRVQDLERLVGLLCRGRSGIPDRRATMGPSVALGLLCPNSAPDIQKDLITVGREEEKEAPLSDGPLLLLMNRALSIESAVQTPTSLDSRSGPGSHAMDALRALALHNQDLYLIFELTEKYWPLWPILPPRFIQVIPSQAGTLDKQTALNFVNSSFQSSIPETMAKGALWLALCIQQLPSEFDFRPHTLPCHRSILLEAYMSGGEELLRSPHDTKGTTTFLECLMLQAKLYINMARPRKAWLTVRRAIDFALLQGIQRLRSSPVSDTLQSLWLEVWVFDRQLSLGLGLPNSVPDSLAHLVRVPDGEFSSWMFHLIGDIAGRINDRNLNIASADYGLTVGIEHELLGLWDRMPAQWDMPNTADTSLADVFTKQIGKFYYNLLMKNAHFPYMVQHKPNGAGGGDMYPHSRATAVEAARRMIEHYQGLRRSSQGALLICDLMDFHVFTGAIVLVVDLISPMVTERDIRQAKQDWMQVEELIQTFQHLSLAMTCTVAKQAADVLRYLYAAAHGFYDGEAYEVVIPYFGKVRISPPVQGLQQQGSSTGSTTCSSDRVLAAPSPVSFNAIEFNTQTFCPLGLDTMGLGDGELGTADWNTFSGFEFDWDWSQVFTVPVNE
ncbi:hypothetical protein BJY01DRAFT_253888 [Aspergillus pseudoustus]|uniref:Zn(2)-C6 fungal-type domain-containing protein n=1 Tax=Aspergillus pseudoustus TaxID=1810923 RepID=A0ABR4IXL6_9EURO